MSFLLERKAIAHKLFREVTPVDITEASEDVVCLLTGQTSKKTQA